MQSTHEVRTTLVEKKVCLKWTVDSNAFHLLIRLKSPEFFVTNQSKTCFFVYRNKRSAGFYEVYLEKCDELDNSIIDVYIFNGEEKVKVSPTSRWAEKTVDLKGTYFLNTFNEPQDEGTSKKIWCEITYLENIEMIEPCCEKILPVTYNQFLKNQELCDIVFLIGTEQIKAHTVILAAASPYFLAMFKNKDMIENTSHKVDLSHDNDVTIENFQGFLDYVYGCKSIDELSSIVYDLVVLADKFDVKQLLQACELYISKDITEYNITKILILSDRYNCKTLQVKAVNFAKSHIDVVKESDDFDELCKITNMVRRLL